ncbi:Protein Barley B recombinant [Acorus calamus]|uniref:GAGA-binding transcriptional activator n=1 Tax=Acorus calamus TaxID=4465 RepID=A0AAV9DLQ6_ACOCL|nr:Protein Barley B recombinant [Acorus calamus]
MDDDGGLGIRNWNYYGNHQPLKGNLGLRLMSTVAADHESKPSVMVSTASSNGAFLHQHMQHPHHPHHPHHQQSHNHHHHHQPSVPMDFVRESWMNHREQQQQQQQHHHHQHHQPAVPTSSNASNNKVLHVLPINYSVLSEGGQPGGGHHTLQMLHPTEHPQTHHPHPMPKEERIEEETYESIDPKKDVPLKKRTHKSPKPKRVKKTPADGAPPRPRPPGGKRKSAGSSSNGIGTGVVINGIDLDISGIPTPVCSCTGVPQQCYRWGIGGWQSACCTTNMSVYPLPMSTKRRGARIAGRKMSQGAFKKVLEKLAGEGHNLSNPIDLKMHWAKHGSNKFVSIR